MLKKGKLISLLIFLIFLVNVNAEKLQDRNEMKPIGIISALEFETAYLKSRLKNVKIRNIFSRKYYEGKLNGKNVIVAQVGIGIVNAAVGTAILIDKFKPSSIVMTGVAGGTNKTVPGDIVIGSKVTFYDLGSLDRSGKFTRMPSFTPDSEFNGSKTKYNPLFFNAGSELMKTAVKASKSVRFDSLDYKGKEYKIKPIEGIITTTEMFTEYPKKIKEMMKATECIAFDMECAGPAQVCYNQKIPFITIKAISDNGNFLMFNALKENAAINAQKLIERMISN